jgi:putative ABC transport system permease protein
LHQPIDTSDQAENSRKIGIARQKTGQQVCRLLPVHFAIALGLTCVTAALAAGLAGLNSARVEPSEGLRDL